MKSEKEFEVGDKVIEYLHGEPKKVSTVKRILKRFLELEDGTKWGLYGYAYPYRTWGTAHISYYVREDHLKLKTKNLISKIRFFDFKSLEYEQLVRINNILKES